MFSIESKYAYLLFLCFRATNIENKEMNKVKNQLTGEYGAVPDTARYYKVGDFILILFLKNIGYTHLFGILYLRQA